MDWQSIEALQKDGRGAYFVVNGGGDTDAEVSVGRSIFCEWDDLDKEIQLTLWQTLGLPTPTIQVDTGGKSIHTYWVFEKPIPIQDWKKLQKDLAVFCSSDAKITNPSRVMRIPGCWHISSDGKKEMSRVVTMSGHKYSYEDLRNIIPNGQQPLLEQSSSWSDFNKNWSFPTTESVPLSSSIKIEHRNLIEKGCSSGSRNGSGFALACDLIGTANYLRLSGQPFDGEEQNLFYQYCQNCPQEEGWDESEWQSIWRSAQKGNKGAALSPEGIENCVKGAAWAIAKDRPSQNFPNGQISLTTQQKEEGPKESVEDKFKTFKGEIAESLKIKSLAQRNFTLQSLLSKYRTTKQVLDLCKMEVLADSDVHKKRSYSFDEFCELVKDEEEWVIPGVLPRGDLSIFIGNSGSGKSLHSYEAAYQVMIGGMFCGGHIQKGKVLFIQTDEGHYSTKHRMVGRGFSLEKESFRIMPRFNFTQLDSLEQELIDFGPDLVVIDTLRDALTKTGIDENTPEAGQPLNDLKDLLKQYNASAILIHYVNKKTEAKGLMRCAGNIAIPAKAYSVFEYSQPTQNNQQEFKMHSIKDRDGAGVTYWHNLDTSNGNWSIEFKTEEGSEAGEAGYCDRIIQLFRSNCEKGVSLDILGGEICSLLGVTPDMRKGLYMALKRLHQRGVLTRTQTNEIGARPIYRYRMSDRHLIACGLLLGQNGVTQAETLSQRGDEASNTPSNTLVTPQRSVTQPTSVTQFPDSPNGIGVVTPLVTDMGVTRGVTSPVTMLDSPQALTFNDQEKSVTQNPPAPAEGVTSPLEPKKDAHPFGKSGYIDRSLSEWFLDHQGKPVFVGSKVVWQDGPPEYKGMKDFVVERIYRETVQLSLVKYPVPYGQLEAAKDITFGFRIGDLIQPNWKALKEAKYPIKEMQEAKEKELPQKGHFVTVTEFYSSKVHGHLCEGLYGVDEFGYKYSINPKYWEKVNVDGDE